jgi:hypothetical protein
MKQIANAVRIFTLLDAVSVSNPDAQLLSSGRGHRKPMLHQLVLSLFWFRCKFFGDYYSK